MWVFVCPGEECDGNACLSVCNLSVCPDAYLKNYCSD